MTTWKPAADMWKGEAVAVIGGGPSATQEAVDRVKKYKRIAVNHAYTRANDADVLLALDSNAEFFKQAVKDGFSGLMLCGGVVDVPDVHYIGQRFEKITLGPAHIIETRNSGLTAIRIAAEMGAEKILLVGFDPETGAHFDGYPDQGLPASEPYPNLSAGLAAVISDLQAQGIAVERVTEEIATRKGRK